MDGTNDFKFAFDFENEFSPVENQIINDILMQPMDTFDQFDLPDMNFLSLSPSDGQFNQFDSSNVTNGVEPIDNMYTATEPLQTDTITGNGDMVMSWTNVMEPSSSTQSELPSNYYECLISEDHSNDAETASYQNLETFDVPQLFDNMQTTFGLSQLKEIDAKLNYSALKMECDASDNSDQGPLVVPHEIKWKTFLMPIKCDANGANSVQQLQQKFKEHPDIVMSIIKQRTQQAKSNETKILLVAPPKKTKQPSKRYASVDEQLRRLDSEEIVVPQIDAAHKPCKRKSAVKLDAADDTEIRLLRVLGTDCYNVINGRLVKCKIVPASPKSDASADDANRTVEIEFGDICQNSRRRSLRRNKQTLK